MSPNNITWGHLMKMSWLIANVTSVELPARAEHENLGIILDVFWPIQAAFVDGEPLCDVGIPS